MRNIITVLFLLLVFIVILKTCSYNEKVTVKNEKSDTIHFKNQMITNGVYIMPDKSDD